VFEAILEDVSKADALAEVIGQTRTERPGNPPLWFEITYDPAHINPSHRDLESRRGGGSGGCNRLGGSYELHGDRLTFGQMAGTMMACPEGSDTEQAFLEALRQVHTWKITRQHLEWFDAAGHQVAGFEARHMQ
jgi:copper homeostasis protein (lipoprotein)